MTKKKKSSLKIPYYHHFKVFIFHPDLQVEQHCTKTKQTNKKIHTWNSILFTHSASLHNILFQPPAMADALWKLLVF